ncbi:MAG: hypothetical protein Q4A93_07235 [Actinomycetota bacterium]|nr:hypothetical protein [Actinomycetota bacterium]
MNDIQPVRAQSKDIRISSRKGKLVMLLVVLATVLAVTGAWFLLPEEPWLDAVGEYEMTLTTSEQHALGDKTKGNQVAGHGGEAGETDGEDAAMTPIVQERRAVALMGRNMQFVIACGIIVLIEVFIYLMLMVNRNIDTMKRRLR